MFSRNVAIARAENAPHVELVGAQAEIKMLRDIITGLSDQLDASCELENALADALRIDDDPAADIDNPAYIAGGGFNGWVLRRIEALEAEIKMAQARLNGA